MNSSKPKAAAEDGQLHETQEGKANWKQWGPYFAERAWGTVREDYSPNGAAWDYFPHDHAHSRVYRWNEDGLAGISDDQQHLCFALALWNGQDGIPQRAIIWPEWLRRQPWRRCQGILFLPSTPHPRTLT